MIYKLDLNISSKCICYDEGLTLKKSSLKLFYSGQIMYINSVNNNKLPK